MVMGKLYACKQLHTLWEQSLLAKRPPKLAHNSKIDHGLVP